MMRKKPIAKKPTRNHWDNHNPVKVGELVEILKKFDASLPFYIEMADGRGNVVRSCEFAIADDDDSVFFATFGDDFVSF